MRKKSLDREQLLPNMSSSAVCCAAYHKTKAEDNCVHCLANMKPPRLLICWPRVLVKTSILLAAAIDRYCS